MDFGELESGKTGRSPRGSEVMKMKLILSLVLFIALVPAFTSNVAAQDSDEEGTGATQSVTDVRTQLQDVQAREAGLQARAKQLEADLKPENIERSLAGIGSTKPEEIRELRRRQLSIELESVRKQLGIIATSRERLQVVLNTAEARAYQQSADGSQNQTLAAQTVNARWIGLIVVGALTLLAGLVALVVVRKRALP